MAVLWKLVRMLELLHVFLGRPQQITVARIVLTSDRACVATTLAEHSIIYGSVEEV